MPEKTRRIRQVLAWAATVYCIFSFSACTVPKPIGETRATPTSDGILAPTVNVATPEILPETNAPATETPLVLAGPPTPQPLIEFKLVRKTIGLPRDYFALSPDNHTIAVIDNADLGVGLYDFESNKQLWQWSIPEEDLSGAPNWLQALAFSPSGEYLAAGGLTKRLYLLDAATGKQVARSQPSHEITRLVFMPDSRKILASTASSDGVPPIDIWDVPAANKSNLPYLGCAFAVKPDTSQVAVFVHDPEPYSIALVDLETNTESVWVPSSDAGCDLAFSSGGLFLAGEFNAELKLWNVTLPNPSPISLPWQSEKASDAYLERVFFAPHDELVLLDSDKVATMWNVYNQTLIAKIPGETYYVGFTSDGKYLIALNDEINVWAMP